MHIDNNFNWKSRINELTKTLGKAIGLLSKVRFFGTKTTLLQIFNSHCAYGCILWSCATDVQLDRINTFQKRTISFSRYNDHTSQHFKE